MAAATTSSSNVAMPSDVEASDDKTTTTTTTTVVSSAVPVLGIIGGTSFLKSKIFASFVQRKVETPHGAINVWQQPQAQPKDEKKQESKEQQQQKRQLYFVQRHAATPGIAYSPPHAINKKGIVFALKSLGCTRVLGFGSVRNTHTHTHTHAHTQSIVYVD
jgi:purine nucleoside phosphorylase